MAVLVLAACGLGDKAEFEDLITAAPEAMEGEIATGTITIESRFHEAPFDAPGGGGGGFGGFGGGAPGFDPGSFEIPDDGIPFGSETIEFQLDLRTSTAALTRPGEDAPFVIIDDLVFYGRRNGVPDTDARPWVRFDMEDTGETTGELDPFSGEGTRAASAVHPALVADLVAGALTGSIERRGGDVTAAAGGSTSVTDRFDANVAFEKAYEDVRRSRFDEDRLEAVLEYWETLGVDGDVHPAEVDLDGEGRVRRFWVELIQRPAKKVRFGLVIELRVDGYDGVLPAALPTPQEVLSVDTLLRFISAVTPVDPDAPIFGPPGVGPGEDAPDGADPTVEEPSSEPPAPAGSIPAPEPVPDTVADPVTVDPVTGDPATGDGST